MRFLRPLGLLVAGFLGASCLPGGRLPEVNIPAARGNATLRPTEASLPPDEGPLKVLHASPEGEEVEGPLPTILFSRSMHRLGAPPGEPAVEATIDPPVEGTWRWVGSRALQFSPKKPFQNATPYRIEVKPGLRSLDGQVIDEAIRLSFSTKRPRLDLADMYNPDDPEDALHLSFSQPVRPSELMRALSISAGGARVAVELREVRLAREAKKKKRRGEAKDEPGDEGQWSIEVVPVKRWPGGPLRISVAPLRAAEGRLTTEAFEKTLREVEPTQVDSISCFSEKEEGECQIGSSLFVSLSSPLRPSQLRPLLKIEPFVPLEIESLDRDSERTDFSIKGPFQVGTPYRLTIRSSEHRQPSTRGLDAGKQFAFKVVPPRPSVHFLAAGAYLLPAWAPEIHASTSRATRAEFMVRPVSFGEFLDGKGASEPWEPQKTESFDAKAQADGAFVSLRELLPAKPGLLRLRARAEGPTGSDSSEQQLHLTELSMEARISAERSLVWVNRLTSAEPVAGADVEIYHDRKLLLRGKTDERGVAMIDSRELARLKPVEATTQRWRSRRAMGRLLVVARVGDDWVSTEVQAPDTAPLSGHLFADREFYRPGEVVHLKGVLRKPSSSGLRPPEDRKVTLVLNLAGTSEIKIEKTLSGWGTFSHDVQLPADTSYEQLGFRIEDGDARWIASARAYVRSVRPAAFKVSAALDRPSYFVGDDFSCDIKGSYLYGGSMASMAADVSAKLVPDFYKIPDLEGFFVGRNWGYRADSHTQAEMDGGRLGPGGAATLRGKISKDTPTGPSKLICEGQVADPGMQVIAASTSAQVHPADFYVAVRDIARNHFSPGESFAPQVLAVSPDGKRRAERVKIELIDTADGKPSVTSSCEVTTGEKPVSCAIRMPQALGGSFTLEASAVDAKGRKTSTRATLATLERPARPQPRFETARPRPVRPEIKDTTPPWKPPFETDRRGYPVGATARVSFDGDRKFREGLLTVEREDVASFHLFGPKAPPLELPLGEGAYPALFLSGWLLTPISAELPRRPHGQVIESYSARIDVDSSTARQLSVALRTSKTDAAPRDTIEVDVDVHGADGAGVASEVTLYAVDEGMLLHSYYEIPDLAYRIQGDPDHRIESGETRSGVGWVPEPVRGRGRLGGSHRTKAPSVRMGATTVSGPDGPRSKFEPTPMYLPSLETDEKGHAHASFKLPDSLTSYRIMAVAVSKKDSYGKAESVVRASLPTQIRPVVPMVIRAGDRFEVPAVAANNTERPVALTASLDVDGFLLDPAKASQPLKLEPGASERVTFPVEARRSGPGKLLFRVKGEGLEDAAEIGTEALVPAPMEASAVYGKTSQAIEEQVADLGAIRPDAGGLEVTLSSSPVAGLGAGLDQLVQYPYGCTEQLTSRLVPLLSLRDLARSLGVALPPDVDERTRDAVSRILQNRHDNGSFGLWQRSTPSPWITAYAIWGLADAHRRGVVVHESVFRGAERYLGEVALGWPRGEQQAAEASFALDVLADLPGVADATRAQALLLARQIAASPQGLPDFGRSMLLHAMARLGAGADELAPQIKALEASLHLDGPVARAVERSSWYFDLLDSRVRSSALALRALLAASPKHPLLEPLALGLVQDRGPKGWRTTQETAWALLALDAYQRTLATGPLQASARMGPKTLLSALLSGPTEQRVKLPMSELGPLGGALRFDASGGGTLFYQARLSYAPVAMPTEPVFAGIEVTRRCRAVDPRHINEVDERPHATSFEVGQWVQCEIEVNTPSPRRFVSIEDPIAGGFETVDPDTRTASNWSRWLSQGRWQRREMRPDRVLFFVDRLSAGVHRFRYGLRAMTAGEFRVPPARAEEMYTPETYGRTAAEVVTVAAR